MREETRDCQAWFGAKIALVKESVFPSGLKVPYKG